MSLAASLTKYKAEVADATSRNIAHSRPASSTPRTSTPTPSGIAGPKRTHETAFANSDKAPAAAITATGTHAGTELFSQVWTAVNYLKEKDGKEVTFDKMMAYLSLPVEAHKNYPLIKRLLIEHVRAIFVPKAQSESGKDSFKYNPKHAVRNAEDLKTLLARQEQGAGIKVADLKDGWPDCIAALDALEKEGSIIIQRNKKDNVPKMVWTDSPNYHVLNPDTHAPRKVDDDFMEMWRKIKQPASELEIRTELEKAGLTPSSLVKEVKGMVPKQKEKRRVNRKGGKTTNQHMLGILKDYSKR